MRLYILRHGIAADAVPGGDDAGRQLTPAGRTRMRAEAVGMRKMGLRFDALLSSPLARAAETAAIVADVLGGPAPRQLAALSPGVAPSEAMRALRPFAREPRVAVVGHEPALSGLVSLALTGSPGGAAVRLKKGGLAVLELTRLVPPFDAVLCALLTPRQLRRLGR